MTVTAGSVPLGEGSSWEEEGGVGHDTMVIAGPQPRGCILDARLCKKARGARSEWCDGFKQARFGYLDIWREYLRREKKITIPECRISWLEIAPHSLRRSLL